MSARGPLLAPDAEARLCAWFCDGDETVFGLLKRAVGEKYLAAYHNAAGGDPASLQTTFNRDKAHYYSQRIELISYWLKASCEENFYWLERRYDDGRPKKLQKNPAKALKDAAKWLHRENSLHNPISESIRQLYSAIYNHTLSGDVFGNDVLLTLSCDDTARDYINSELSYTPREFVKAHLAGLNGSYHAQLEMLGGPETDDPTIKLNIDGQNLNCSRYYCMGQKIVKTNGAGTARQGIGIFKQFFRNQLKICGQLGMNKISLGAAHIGQYAWARYGYVPDDSSWKKLKSDLLEALPDYKDRISENSYRQIEAALGSDNPKALWLIADQREKIDGHPIGFHLLKNGPHWYGALDLNDADSVARCEAYINPTPPLEQRSAPRRNFTAISHDSSGPSQIQPSA